MTENNPLPPHQPNPNPHTGMNPPYPPPPFAQGYPPPYPQPYPPSYPVQPPHAPAPAPNKRKVWPWVVVGLIVLMFGGCATMCASIGSKLDSHAGSAHNASAPTAGIGQEVRDGKFTFVVNDVSTDSSGKGFSKPRGEYVVVTVTVTNSGNEPQSFFANSQKLIDSAGREYAADSLAAMTMSDDSMAINLNPGFTIEVKVPFDVPPGTQPASIQLHDSMFSGGATVRLS